MLRELDPVALLKSFVAQYDTQQDAAKALNISPPYLSDLLRGNRQLSDAVLEQLGARRTVVAK